MSGSPAGPRRISASLPEAARRIGVDGAVELAALEGAWPGMVGEQVAAHCQPVSVHNGCLTISVDHPAWASELRILEAELVSRARAHVPGITRIFVQVGPRGGGGW